MSLVCPNGHRSGADDYCDTCGAPMEATPAPGAGASAGAAPEPPTAPSPAPAPAPPAEPVDEPQRCPNCGAANAPTFLFCEACGYDFTTGAMPRPIALAEGSFVDLPAASPAPVTAPEAAAPPAEASEAGSAGPSGAPATPAREAPPAEAPPAPTGPVPAHAEAHRAEPPAAPAPAPENPAPPRRSSRPANLPPSRAGAPSGWVVEVWVDPDWYAVQSSDEACPSPMVPDVVPLLGHSALVGRHSSSRSSRPDVDCGTDSGASRRQALLSSDGRRWWIEDLDSANGTYVGPASGELPSEPITPGRRVEIDADDRVYVGAWTRLVVRPATASEKAQA